MLLIESIKNTLKKWAPGSNQNNGVKLQFKNESKEFLLSFRVIVGEKVHEFKNLGIDHCTSPLLLNESQLYFFSYIVTSDEKFYSEPDINQVRQTVKKGEITISIFIEYDSKGQAKVLMYPRIK